MSDEKEKQQQLPQKLPNDDFLNRVSEVREKIPKPSPTVPTVSNLPRLNPDRQPISEETARELIAAIKQLTTAIKGQ